MCNALITRAEAALAPIPPVPLTDEAGRPIGLAQIAALGAQRAAEIARLERRRAEAEAALPPPPAAAAIKPTDPATLRAVVVLLEAIKACGLFAVGAGQPTERRQPAQVTPLDAARALARKRWGEPKSA